MQELIRSFVADLARAVALEEPIVEFGSLNVDPEVDADLRPLFPGREYVGTDIRPGPGVDRVEDLRALSFADGEVGTALCLDTLEHVADPLAACREMRRVLRPGGVCVISSVMLFGIHGYPSDYWRFTPEGFRLLLDGFDEVWVAGIGDPGIPTQVLGVGAKERRLGLSLDRLPTLSAEQAHWERAEGSIRVGPLRLSLRETLALLAREGPRAARERAASRARRLVAR